MSQTPANDPLGLAGTVVEGKYKVETVVGEGGFAVVYRAQHLIWNQPVALKCFSALAGVPAQLREEFLQGFIQEGKLMTSLSSRTAAIVQARDIGTLKLPQGGEVPYMVLEWLQGQPLDRVLAAERQQGLPPRSIFEVMSLLEPVASALDVVHAQNIAHRDIKPANIFVIGDPRGVGTFVKILDFGIAKVMAEHAALQTSLAHTGKEVTAFTPTYGAPEQFSRSHGATGPWTDVFALALVMVELLRGGLPALSGDDYLQLAVASRDPMVRPTPRAFGIAVTDEVEAVFLRALAVSPRDRYKTAGEMWTDLHAAVFPGGPGWSSVTVGGAAGSRAASSLSASAPTPGALGGTQLATPLTGPSSVIDTGPGQRAAPSAPTTPLVAPGQVIAVDTTGRPMASTRPPAPGSKGTLVAGAVGGLLLVGAVGAYFAISGRSSVEQTASAAPAAASATATASAVAAPPSCPEGMTLVPAGKFFMGSDDTSTFPLWAPAHKVTLSAYCMDTHEVTAAAYKACVDQGECKRAEQMPSYPKSESTTDAQHEKNRQAYAELCNFGPDNSIKPGREKHPVNCVSWESASQYCEVHKKRLPTEAEWEFAARGSDGRKFPWGDQPGADGKHMNACGKECAAWELAHGIEPKTPTMYEEDDGWPGTAPVGTFQAGVTKFGAYDMVGNVWEWTSDWYATYEKAEQTNPKGAATGDRKAIRGGGFNGGFSAWVDPAFRYHQLATASSHGIGFRCAKSLGGND